MYSSQKLPNDEAPVDQSGSTSLCVRAHNEAVRRKPNQLTEQNG